MLSAGRLAPRRATVCAAVALATAVMAAPLLAPEAALATGQPDDVVGQDPTMRVAPLDPLLQDGEGLALEIEIENPGSDATAPTTVEVLLTSAPISTRYSLSRWFAGDAFLASSVITSVEVPAIDALERLSLQATVDAEELGLEGRAWGAYGVAASAPDLGGANTIIVRDAPGESQPTSVALAAPIDAEIDDSGLLDAETLETLTSRSGGPRRALDAALDAGATIGIDPAFGTSIEALGSDAPDDAIDWLDRADTASTYSLLYGNADPFAQLRAGTFPLEPRGIPRADADPLPASLGSIGQRQPVVDATKEIVQQAELTALADFGTVVFSTELLDDGPQNATPSAHARVGGVDVLAADAELQELVHAAGSADPLESSAVRAKIVALLATVTRERPSDPRMLAAVLPASSGGDTAPLLADLAEAQFVRTTDIDAALAAPPRDAALAAMDDPDRSAGAELVSDALEQEAAVASIASIVDEPATLLAELRLELLAALPTAGRPVTDADRLAIASLADSLKDIRTAVEIVGGSDIHAVGESVGLPITITNRLEVPANVVLTLRPTNALVSVDQPRVDVTVAPESQQRVQVPIDVVGTGTLWMIVQLHTPDGVPLGQTQMLRISAQPTIEVAVAWAIGAAIVLLLGFGIFRSIQKRRRGEARGDIDVAARSHDQTRIEGTTEGTA